jgi:hypothetical protein
MKERLMHDIEHALHPGHQRLIRCAERDHVGAGYGGITFYEFRQPSTDGDSRAYNSD